MQLCRDYSLVFFFFLSFLYNWRLAEHVEKIIVDIIAPTRVLKTWQLFSTTLRIGAQDRENKGEKKQKKKLLNFTWHKPECHPAPHTGLTSRNID